MSSYQLPLVSNISQLSTVDKVAVLDALFEPSTALHTLSLDPLHTKTFTSYNDLIQSIGSQLTELTRSTTSSDSEWLDRILGAHPRLGSKKVESAQSKQEQAQLNRGGNDEAKKLKALNDEYEATFPGLIYVVFVNGRGREEIMANMRWRIDRGDIRLERAEAIKAMCDIAADRAVKLQR